MMNHYIDPGSGELYAYSDQQVADDIVKEGLLPCPARPSRNHMWINGAWVETAPVPVVPTSVTPLQFIERFTEAEQLSIVTAAMSNAQLRLWYDKLMAAQEVVFTDPRLSAGLDALVAAGLITAERKAELLTP